MIPHHSADAPMPEKGVLARMKRVNANLRVTFSPVSLNPLTGQPIRMDNGELVEDPCHYLWLKDDVTNHHIYLNMFPLDEGGFGHRNCHSLETDIARHMNPREMGEWLRAREESMKAKDQKRFRESQADKVDANKSRINDLIVHGKSGAEKPKTYSYPGQSDHRSAEEKQTQLKDPRADGWELPEN